MIKSQHEQKWRELHANRQLLLELDTDIQHSWNRCYQYGIDPDVYNIPKSISLPNMDNNIHIGAASPILIDLVSYLPKNNILFLFDKYVRVIRIFAPKDIREKFNASGFGEGSEWSEQTIGTNAAALGIAQAKPKMVVGYEHFCASGIPFTDAFAPVIDQSKLIGGIGALIPVEEHNDNILVTLILAAKYLESQIGADRWNIILNESISEGVLAVDDQERVFYMNKSCHKILHFPIQPTARLPLNQIIDTSKPENHYFWSTIRHGHLVTDESMVFTVGQEKIRCNVSITPTELKSKYFSGKIIIFQEVERINRIIRNFVGQGALITFDDIIGHDPNFELVKQYAIRAAASSSNILILGESGSGKDVLAQAIHNESPRRNGPFLAVNCAALPRELIASELFGYEDGAFTGAKKGGNMGKFELADHGTLFLDEIGDMPLDLQAILLRVIEEKKIMRIGGGKAIPVNVRIIAATNKDLEDAVACNKFRSDLFYRLGVIRLYIPPLRERIDDISYLSQHFTKVISKRLNKPDISLAPEVISAFQSYNWPGNIRELQNIIEGAIQMSTSSIINEDLIKPYLSPIVKIPRFEPAPLTTKLNQTDKEIIQSYMNRFDNNKSKVAKALGITRKTLYKRLKEYGLTDD